MLSLGTRLISLFIIVCTLLCVAAGPSKTACKQEDMCDGKTKKCSYNQEMTVTIEINDGISSNNNGVVGNSTNPSFNSSTSTYYGFCVKTDTFYQLTVLDSYLVMNQSNTSFIRIWAGDQASEAHYYNSPDQKNFATYFTAVINLSGGLVTKVDGNNNSSSIIFQNGCDVGGFGCLLTFGLPCIRGLECGKAYAQSTSNEERNVNLFLAFQGTASNDAQLESAGYLPQNFRQYSLTTYFNTIVNTFVPPV
ncbi:hypothetical protein AKO1_013003 [Acrasis kona]|uniref:Uncharacterized protein n=1 Tax=Acrasis kona TaxID=1008807 RepID=A0AAW2YZ45_9EUKA